MSKCECMRYTTETNNHEIMNLKHETTTRMENSSYLLCYFMYLSECVWSVCTTARKKQRGSSLIFSGDLVYECGVDLSE